MNWKFWERKNYALQSSIRSVMRVNTASWSGRAFSAFAEEGYRDNPTVRACIDAIIDAATACPIILKDPSGNGLDNAPLLDLIKKPNARQTWPEFLRQVLASRLIGGEGDILKTFVGRYGELISLRPDQLEIDQWDAFGRPSLWRHLPMHVNQPIMSVQRIESENLMIWKAHNPLDPWRGLSPMWSCAFAVDTLNEYARSNKATLENGVTPSGVLSTETTLEDDAFKRLQDQFTDKYAGSKNTSKPLLLEGGLSWQQIGLSPREMEYINGKRVNELDVCKVYKVPPQIVGIEGSQTFANYEQARAALYEDTVIPLVNQLLESIRRFVETELKVVGYYLYVDIDAVAALEPRRADRNKTVDGMQSLTINEKRSSMGYEDTNGGDQILINSSLIPLDLAGADLMAGESE